MGDTRRRCSLCLTNNRLDEPRLKCSRIGHLTTASWRMICLAFIQFSRPTSLTVTFALSVTVIGKIQTWSWSKFFAFSTQLCWCLNDFPRLYCRLRFHIRCIFTHWDSYTIFSNPCCNCRVGQGWLKDYMDFPAQKQDKCYSWGGGTMAKDDSNLDWGIRRCLQKNWPGGDIGSS
jgi:hypothetical protein